MKKCIQLSIDGINLKEGVMTRAEALNMAVEAVGAKKVLEIIQTVLLWEEYSKAFRFPRPPCVGWTVE